MKNFLAKTHKVAKGRKEKRIITPRFTEKESPRFTEEKDIKFFVVTVFSSSLLYIKKSAKISLIRVAKHPCASLMESVFTKSGSTYYLNGGTSQSDRIRVAEIIHSLILLGVYTGGDVPVSYSGFDLYVMSSGGGGKMLLATNASQPAFEPNGNRVAFMRDTNIYVVNSGGGGETLFISNASWPAWNADGTKIAFARVGPDDGGCSRIYCANTFLPTEALGVSGGGTNDVCPKWCPTAIYMGGKVVYSKELQRDVNVIYYGIFMTSEITGIFDYALIDQIFATMLYAGFSKN